MSVSAFTLGLSDMGSDKRQYATLRELPHKTTWRAVCNSALDVSPAHAVVLLLSLVVFVLAPTIAGTIWHDNGLTQILQLSLLIGIFGTLPHVPVIYSQSIGRFRMNTIIQVVQALISLAGILLVAFFALWHVDPVIIVSVIAAAIGALAFITVTPKAAFFKFDTSWRSIHFKLGGASSLQRLRAAKRPR